MDLLTAITLGAAGGALVEAITIFAQVEAWQEARRRKRSRGRGKLPTFATFVDLPARLAAGITRLVLGGVAGAVFHDQLAGIAAAIAVGASAPAVLHQLAAFQSARQAVEQTAEPGARTPVGEPLDHPEASR
ncbi:hypothetical protein ABZ816_18940 [Actinosynnema sp. NPDC047251]|uniref:Uncharacterized protein n=1 Tax=Saccharothrix espanaensis (strain ATCC 51144 / DSM 44229 / JCM 9112 / NBRC 15066 / NRRL 15764) TaxID=1179773 RepID=K0K9G6_SACES|nr:hypothetical protein [Saccharothrix espanaensis]CCH33263.1 hypothetical protein BN6_60070 [Saccharothrix espanaensis DSM 44229]